MLRPTLALVIITALAATALANPRDAAIALFEQGARKYKAEQYADAAELFDKAYALDPQLAYVFNAGHAFRLAKRCVEAHDRYTRYLTSAPKASNAAEVRAYLSELEPCVARERPPTPPPTVVEPTPDPVVVTPDPVVVAPVVSPTPDDGRGRRRIGLVLVGVGGLAAAVGVVGAVKGLGASSDLEDLYASTSMWDADDHAREVALLADGKSGNRLAAVGFTVAGVAIATGAILYVTGRRRTERRVVVVPTRNGAVVSLGF